MSSRTDTNRIGGMPVLSRDGACHVFAGPVEGVVLGGGSGECIFFSIDMMRPPEFGKYRKLKLFQGVRVDPETRRSGSCDEYKGRGVAELC